MSATLTIIRYPKKYIFFALLSMAVFHLPLWLNKKNSFYKLLGSGKNGTFDKNPDWQQWGILTVLDHDFTDLNNFTDNIILGSFIYKWLVFFNCETWTIILKPIEGHGKWDDKEVFGELPKQSDHQGPVAILTRATIRISKLKAFWKNVDGVASQMNTANGLITSIGIGEMPYIKQATFSIWESKEAMKQFAYSMQQHKDVIQRTRKENWYSEDMFVRFKILHSSGTIKGKNPLKIK